MLDAYLFQYVGKAKSYIANSVLMMMTRILGIAPSLCLLVF